MQTTTPPKVWPALVVILLAALTTAGLLAYFAPPWGPLARRHSATVIMPAADGPPDLHTLPNKSMPPEPTVADRLDELGRQASHMRRQLGLVVGAVETLGQRVDALAEGLDHTGMRVTALDLALAAKPWRTEVVRATRRCRKATAARKQREALK